MVHGSITGTTDSYGRKEPTRTVRKKVLRLNITEMDSYGSKEPTRTVRKKVLGSGITSTDG